MNEKQCNSCARILPLKSFSPDKRGSGGVRGKCKGCVNEATRWVRWAKVRDIPTDKICASCERTKSHQEFTKDAARTDGLGSYCLACREHKYYGRYRDSRPTASERRK